MQANLLVVVKRVYVTLVFLNVIGRNHVPYGFFVTLRVLGCGIRLVELPRRFARCTLNRLIFLST